MWFDTHCHFDFSVFQQAQQQHLKQCQQHDVQRLFVPAVNEQNWSSVLELTKLDPIYVGLGIHPAFIGEQDPKPAERLTQLKARVLQCRSVINAIGECGLDKRFADTMQQQTELFVGQMEIALQCRLPLVMHSVHCHHLIVQHLKQAGGGLAGVIHGFSGNYQQAKAFVDLGLKIGVGGVISRPSAHKTRDAVSRLPVDSLVLETDSPDMRLHNDTAPYNSPHKIPMVFQHLLPLRTEKPTILGQILWKNSNELYSIVD